LNLIISVSTDLEARFLPEEYLGLRKEIVGRKYCWRELNIVVKKKIKNAVNATLEHKKSKKFFGEKPAQTRPCQLSTSFSELSCARLQRRVARDG
jgi:hypothetical protein